MIANISVYVCYFNSLIVHLLQLRKIVEMVSISYRKHLATCYNNRTFKGGNVHSSQQH